jgi:hypothetical protein
MALRCDMIVELKNCDVEFGSGWWFIQGIQGLSGQIGSKY